VALASTVEHLLKTGRTFHAAFHARIGQSKQVDGCKGRGSQSQKKLMDVARQMSALNFTVFLVGTGDIMRGCIVPLAMSSQEVGGQCPSNETGVSSNDGQAHWSSGFLGTFVDMDLCYRPALRAVVF
jgi:hypothetical protein